MCRFFNSRMPLVVNRLAYATNVGIQICWKYVFVHMNCMALTCSSKKQCFSSVDYL